MYVVLKVQTFIPPQLSRQSMRLLTAVSLVRVQQGELWPSGSVGQSAALSRRRSRVRVSSGSFLLLNTNRRKQFDSCRSGGTGRRPGLKIPWVVIPVPVRFRSAALIKSRRNAEFTAFLLFFYFKKFETPLNTFSCVLNLFKLYGIGVKLIEYI